MQITSKHILKDKRGHKRQYVTKIDRVMMRFVRDIIKAKKAVEMLTKAAKEATISMRLVKKV